MRLTSTSTIQPSNAHRSYEADSNTLLSARYDDRVCGVAVGGIFRREIAVAACEFADPYHALDDERVRQLFNYIWKKVKLERADVVLDLSHVQSVTPRFDRELAYMCRQLGQQGLSVRLTTV